MLSALSYAEPARTCSLARALLRSIREDDRERRRDHVEMVPESSRRTEGRAGSRLSIAYSIYTNARPGLACMWSSIVLSAWMDANQTLPSTKRMPWDAHAHTHMHSYTVEKPTCLAHTEFRFSRCRAVSLARSLARVTHPPTHTCNRHTYPTPQPADGECVGVAVGWVWVGGRGGGWREGGLQVDGYLLRFLTLPKRALHGAFFL